MQEIIVSKTKTTTIKHVIYGTPLPGSYGDYLLMLNSFKIKELAYSSEHNTWKIVLFHHYNFLLKEQLVHGSLTCAFCGKQHLKIRPVGIVIPKEETATVDHFYPRHIYEDRLDEDNMVVACEKCNQYKGETIYSVDALVYITKEKENIIKDLKNKINLYNSRVK